MKNKLYLLLFCVVISCQSLFAQSQLVNVFLGSEGDHGQVSPGAAAPFGMMDIAPQTYPNTHTGYEHRAKVFLGFTHNRMEGVGCRGSGGNLLIKPFVGTPEDKLIKARERAEPGFYSASFANGIRVAIAVSGNAGVEQYHFPKGKHGFYIDLAHTLANRFVAEEHHANARGITGWIQAGTTCSMGVYKMYYQLEFDAPVAYADSSAHAFTVLTDKDMTIRVAFSSAIDKRPVEIVKARSRKAWDKELSKVRVTGNAAEVKLFYSLLYRTLQTPYQIGPHEYNGWSIWDNYRTELPLLGLTQPGRYQDMVNSIANLYHVGKKDWATMNEPSNSVRTEHAIVVLLDAYRKGYRVDFKSIRDSLLKEVDHLDCKTPDKALESSYDTWAMAEILSILKENDLSKVYHDRAAQWKTYWDKDFKDITKRDIDQLGARGMYQGTIWQYRWFVPFDVKGLITQCGGEQAYLQQLNAFFEQDYYCAANEPDIQAPYMYQFTSQPWLSQAIIHRYAKDTVVQYYEDQNYRGIGPQIGRVYNNRPDGLLKTMDDDAGEMSSWYVMAACGLSPACVGWPVYYLHVPLFKNVKFNRFTITVVGAGKYIRSAILNGKPLDRNWITQAEIMQGGQLSIVASAKPNKSFGVRNQWLTGL